MSVSVTTWIAACQASLSFTISWSLLKLLSIVSMMPYNHLIFYHFLLFLPSIFPSINVFSNKLAVCIRWPKDWCFSFCISPSNGFQDWLPLGWAGWISSLSKGLSRVFAYHSSKASVLRHSVFFMVQLSHPYMTTGKTTVFPCTFVSKVIPLLFNTLSRLVIAFLPRSKLRFISWPQALSAVILEPKKINL